VIVNRLPVAGSFTASFSLEEARALADVLDEGITVLAEKLDGDLADATYTAEDREAMESHSIVAEDFIARIFEQS
jgi:hypothetical protein